MDATPIIQFHRLVPILDLPSAAAATPLGEALVEGGLPIAEVTVHHDAALESLRRMDKIPGLLVGAGAVTNVDQARAAHDAGARFLSSPGCFPKVIAFAIEAGLPIFPGVATPTDIGTALDCGASVLKFFPAEALGGVLMLKALAVSFPSVTFIASGGIDTSNVSRYLALSPVVACGASWIAPKELLLAADFAEIRNRTADSVELVRYIPS